MHNVNKVFSGLSNHLVSFMRYSCQIMAFAMRTAVPIDLYCYTDFDYTVIAVCCNVLYKTHLIAYDGY